MRIMSLQKQLEYNKGLFVYRVLSNEAPEYINLYTHTLPHAIPILGTITLVCLGQGPTYSKQVYPSLVLIYGTTYL